MRVIPLLLLLACSGAEPAAAEPTRQDPSVEAPAEAPGQARGGSEPTHPCPVLVAAANSARGGGVEPSVNGEDITIDLEAVQAALPESAAGLPRDESSTWARGMAGHWSPGVLAFYTHEGSRVGVEVTDLVHVCTCDSGMGDALRDLRMRGMAGARSLDVASHPAVLAAPTGRPEELEVWVNDRCSVRLWAAPAEVLQRLALALDWPALSAACPTRP